MGRTKVSEGRSSAWTMPGVKTAPAERRAMAGTMARWERLIEAAEDELGN